MSAQRDRQTWVANDAHGLFKITSGLYGAEIGRSARIEDRDFLLLAAKALDPMAAALTLCIGPLEIDRESLVFSYAEPPAHEGQEPDIETINDRRAYNKVRAIDAALKAVRAALDMAKAAP